MNSPRRLRLPKSRNSRQIRTDECRRTWDEKETSVTALLRTFVALFSAILIGGCVQSTGPASNTVEPELVTGLQTRALRVDARDWSYSMSLPAGQPPTNGWPLVLILHGSGERGRDHLEGNGWIPKAEQARFVALAPDAQPLEPKLSPHPLFNPRIWNAGQPYLTPARAAIDDISFFAALLDQVATRIPIDPTRVYVVGHSSGGAMAFRLVAERAETFAAACVLASACWVSDPQPAVRVPTLYIVGTADPLQPLEGGSQHLLWLNRTTPPVTEILAGWARAMSCDPQITVLTEDNDLLVSNFGSCADATSLLAIFVKGLGHRWPGGSTPRLPNMLVGPTANSFNATDAIWEFFESKSRIR
jgi:polyhydroxybutyrate depolymerase